MERKPTIVSVYRTIQQVSNPSRKLSKVIAELYFVGDTGISEREYREILLTPNTIIELHDYIIVTDK